MSEFVRFDPSRKKRKNVVQNLKLDYVVLVQEKHRQYKINKKKKMKGIIVAMAIAIGGVGIGVATHVDNNVPLEETAGNSYAIDENNKTSVIDVSIDELKNLNVVLVDDGIEDEKIAKAAEDLQRKGLDVEVRDIDNLNSVGTETFISLKEYGGDYTKVICNYNNGNNHADLLSLSMSCETDGVLQRGVNQVGADITIKVPANIEKNVDRIMPTVTLAVPESEEVNTNLIVNGLARYNDYFKKNSIDEANFLSRGETSIYDIEQKYGSDVLSLNNLNSGSILSEDEVILLKQLPNSLDRNVEVSVQTVNSNKYNNIK